MAVVPGMTELTAPYWAAAREGRLVVPECRSCRQVWHPPLPRCPHCHAPLRADEAASELVCTNPDDCGLAYPVRDDIPVLLIDEARRP